MWAINKRMVNYPEKSTSVSRPMTSFMGPINISRSCTWNIYFSCVLLTHINIFLSSVQSLTLERAHQCLVHWHHGSRVVELSTIIWCTENSHKLPSSKEFVAVLHNLVHTYVSLTMSARWDSPHSKIKKPKPCAIPNLFILRKWKDAAEIGEYQSAFTTWCNERHTYKHAPMLGISMKLVSKFTWCARTIRSKSCLRLNFSTTSAPNVNDTPLSLSAQPLHQNTSIRYTIHAACIQGYVRNI